MEQLKNSVNFVISEDSLPQEEIELPDSDEDDSDKNKDLFDYEEQELDGRFDMEAHILPIQKLKEPVNEKIGTSSESKKKKSRDLKLSHENIDAFLRTYLVLEPNRVTPKQLMYPETSFVLFFALTFEVLIPTRRLSIQSITFHVRDFSGISGITTIQRRMEGKGY